MAIADTFLKCVECGTDFLFSFDEQEFYALMGVKGEPNRCPACRTLYKDFKRAPPVPAHRVVCDMCGGEYVLPFKPIGRNPFYCPSCYRRAKDQRDQMRAGTDARSKRIVG